MPRISILLPARNAAATLPAALRSIRRQTFGDWELVAVDDGSADRTAELLADVGKIGKVITTSGVGLVEALRRAADVATGPLLARMDADDVMHPRRLELQVAGMEDVDVLATRVRTRAAEGMRRYVEWQNGLLTHQEITGAMFVESPLVHPSVMMRRTSFDRAGGYRDAGWAEDYDLWQRLRESGARFGKRPETLLAWRDSPGRLTRTHPMYAEKAFHAAKLHYFLRHPLSKGPLVVWGAGPIGKAWMRDLRAAGREVVAAIDIDPKKIGRTVAGGVRVLSPEAGLARGGAVLGAVGSRGARDLIRARLVTAGLAEAKDFLFVA